jgi:excisionase family DNA binding protein
MSDRLAAALAELVAALREEVAAEARPAAPDRLLSVDEAGAALGLGRSKIYGEIAAGRLRTIRAGRRRLVPAAAIVSYIRALEEANADGSDRAA